MDDVTTLILLGADDEELTPINAWLAEHGHAPGLTRWRWPSAFGAFRDLALAAFVRRLRDQPWGEHIRVELLARAPGQPAFRAHLVHPIGHDADTFASLDLAAMEAELGPFDDPLLIAWHEGGDQAVLGALAGWLADHAGGAALLPATFDARAWLGRTPYGTWRAWAVPGTYDHAWAVALLTFLQGVPGGLGYSLATGSPAGWRTISSPFYLTLREEAEVTALEPGDLREFVRAAFGPEDRAAPFEAELARLDAALAERLRRRGYVVAGPDA